MNSSALSSVGPAGALTVIVAVASLCAPAGAGCEPQIMSAYDTVRADWLCVSGTVAYFVGIPDLQAVDLSDPANPTVLDSLDLPGLTPLGLTVAGDYAYVSFEDVFGSFELHVIDVSIPADLWDRGSVSGLSLPRGIAAQGSFVYVADDYAGLTVIDVSTPWAPFIYGSVDTPGFAIDVVTKSTKAYVADAGYGLQVIDIADPAHPAIIGTVDTPGTAQGVALSGTLVYVADGEAGVQVINVFDPAAPTIVGSVDTPDEARQLATRGTLVFVADTAGGMQVIDASNPASPALLGGVDMPASAVDVCVVAPMAYVATINSGIQMTDWPLACGACCINDGCLDLAPDPCASVSGTFLGDGSRCISGSCPPAPCPSDRNGNGAVDFADILVILGDWGPCP